MGNLLQLLTSKVLPRKDVQKVDGAACIDVQKVYSCIDLEREKN